MIAYHETVKEKEDGLLMDRWVFGVYYNSDGFQSIDLQSFHSYERKSVMEPYQHVKLWRKLGDENTVTRQSIPLLDLALDELKDELVEKIKLAVIPN